MELYTVHFRPPPGECREGIPGPGADRDLVLIKEGFCWPAFFFSFFWALWNRLWLVAAAFLALELLLSAVLRALAAEAPVQAALSLGLALAIGLVANDLRRWTCARRGLKFIDVVTGDGRDGAERRFLDHNPQIAGGL